jgi:hypothetical protein
VNWPKQFYPKTQTPGAKDLKLDQFIDKMIKQVLSKDDQQLFLKGMEAFEAEAKELNGKTLLTHHRSERSKLLQSLSRKQERCRVPYGI